MLMERVRMARKMRQLTQQQLAARLGISPKTLVAYETGHFSPSLDLLEKIAGETGLPLFWFLLPTHPKELENCCDVFARERSVLARVWEVLAAFRGYMQRDMTCEEWQNWATLPVEHLYSEILEGRLQPLGPDDLRKVHQYLQEDAGLQGTTSAVFYLYCIWARPRHPSGESDGDYIRRVSTILPSRVA